MSRGEAMLREFIKRLGEFGNITAVSDSSCTALHKTFVNINPGSVWPLALVHATYLPKASANLQIIRKEGDMVERVRQL